MCFAHGSVGRFLVHTWVNAEPVPRFYPNVVTLTTGEADVVEQRQAVRILQKSNLPGRWAVKDSFNTLDIARLGFELLFEANWIRLAAPVAAEPAAGLAWERGTHGGSDWPAALFSDDNFAHFSARRGDAIVAGGTLYRSDGVVGLSNVVADTHDAVHVWRDLAGLAAKTFPGFPVVGYESGDELKAARRAGFEIGDPLRIWVIARE